MGSWMIRRWCRRRMLRCCEKAAFLAIGTTLHATFWMTLAVLTSRTTFRHRSSAPKVTARQAGPEPDTSVQRKPQEM